MKILLVNVVGYLGAVAQYNKHYSEIFMQIYYCFAIHGSTDLQVGRLLSYMHHTGVSLRMKWVSALEHLIHFLDLLCRN